MPTIELQNKEIIACSELYLDENIATNLATVQNFHQAMINTIIVTVLQY